MHDEAAPGTGSRVISGSGATRPTGSAGSGEESALSLVGGRSPPSLTYFPTKSRPRPHGVTATHQQPRGPGGSPARAALRVRSLRLTSSTGERGTTVTVRARAGQTKRTRVRV